MPELDATSWKAVGIGGATEVDTVTRVVNVVVDVELRTVWVDVGAVAVTVLVDVDTERQEQAELIRDAG